ncbi:hypothetical protein [Thalassotalea mangrovi]|uniref:Uncharacterized protein n=1 Tax=Thalassotalea mangrovi TaxID=2572245 RepID=A0A4U1B7K8_9GAMM|nr:hypothetical protein [Thalassotalea mangrovi]TKB46584.1 hypothetical protein E8M12_03240 [Thalassotalea mangrovi]
MNELTLTELEQVSGGNPVLIGIGIGVGANYVYDSVGGMDGINAGFSAVGDFFVEAWENDPVVSMF